ncbi:unnamed protein product [Paramecium primaurelia]|uniref:Uncharacterized protein n=1 Tax=Paramecium primaurelia TaxID=5886 RepID=A0A8S1LYK7_PARPR|nr:unnamed protein product [Paramecium primaurelia]
MNTQTSLQLYSAENSNTLKVQEQEHLIKYIQMLLMDMMMQIKIKCSETKYTQLIFESKFYWFFKNQAIIDIPKYYSYF